jgi:UDP-N-acetylglucosamine 2-epimerase
MKTVLTVVGARPQFIKAAPISRALKGDFNEVIIHTGQHYDRNMSEVFFKQLSIPEPNENLDVGSGSHAYQTGIIMIKLEEALTRHRPDGVIIYGDTNSTLAASIASAKLHIPVAHVEAGLRNFDLSIPEEVNRVVADKLSDYLFAPTKTAVDNLSKEGITSNVFLTGDVMYDTLLYALETASNNSSVLSQYDLLSSQFSLCTIHRAENTDNVENLKVIIEALSKIGSKIILPIHPRTRKVMDGNDIKVPDNVMIIPSLGYLDFLLLEQNAQKIITDSGGVQREAYCLKKPCITIFPSTSWIETVEDGWNTLSDCRVESIVYAFHNAKEGHRYEQHYGDGHAARRIVGILKREF